MLGEIRTELSRVGAGTVRVSLDREFEPETGELVKVQLESAYWHLLPTDFLEILKTVEDGAGDESVKEAIETKATQVWHGPAPEGSRDAS